MGQILAAAIKKDMIKEILRDEVPRGLNTSRISPLHSTRRRSAALSKRDTWSNGQVSKDHATFGHSNDAIDARIYMASPYSLAAKSSPRRSLGDAPLLILDSVRKDGQRFSFVVKSIGGTFAQVNHLGRSGQPAWDIMTRTIQGLHFQFPPLLGRR